MSSDAIPASECAHLVEFKRFLASTAEKAAAVSEEVVSRSCVTRTSNETYKVSGEERHAELVSAIWKQLETRGCPAQFRIKLLHRSTQQLERDLCFAKECEVTVEGPPQYDLLKLQKFVASEFEKYILKLTDNSEVDRLKDFADEAATENCECHQQKNPCTHLPL
ncbi:GM17069 [Drosophila sechellia]|uniref:GM17069 n=1 Tax=Drosophila sechellia TaxID=7238 RepID=B4I5J8_DROSE|nr:GM17069 [Drosophila sechellia]